MWFTFECCVNIVCVTLFLCVIWIMLYALLRGNIVWLTLCILYKNCVMWHFTQLSIVYFVIFSVYLKYLNIHWYDSSTSQASRTLILCAIDVSFTVVVLVSAVEFTVAMCINIVVVSMQLNAIFFRLLLSDVAWQYMRLLIDVHRRLLIPGLFNDI